MLLQPPVILCQWYFRIASAIVAIVIVIENAIVSFYDQICGCKCKIRKESMPKMRTNYIQNVEQPTGIQLRTYPNTILNNILWWYSQHQNNYLRSLYILTIIHRGHCDGNHIFIQPRTYFKIVCDPPACIQRHHHQRTHNSFRCYNGCNYIFTTAMVVGQKGRGSEGSFWWERNECWWQSK